MIRTMLAVAALAIASAAQGQAELEKKLHASDDRQRQEAVQGLAQLATKEAWLRVVEALKDPSPRVADEAEIQLARASDPAVTTELLGKAGIGSGDAWVVLHAAGALAHAEKPEGTALIAALATKSDEARAIVCAGIEAAARAQRLDVGDATLIAVALEKSIQPAGKGPPSHAAALLALCALQPEKAADWIARVDAKQSREHLCALLALAATEKTPAAAKLLALGAAHPDRAVRAQTADSLAQAPDAERLALLTTLLAAEKNARLFWTIDEHLERLSGLAGGGKPDFWKGWAAKLGPEWKPATGERRYAAAGDTEAPKLAGMPILSGNLAILVDFSGSTWAKRADGTTVKQRLDAELEKALLALPTTARFNVIPYANAPIPWEKKLAPATPANVAKALKFFVACKESGKGNLWDAIDLALEDPDVDTLLVLTDGAPTGGRRWNLDLMRARYLEQDRFRHVVVDAVLVDAKKFLREKWEAWCADTGGRVLALDP